MAVVRSSTHVGQRVASGSLSDDLPVPRFGFPRSHRLLTAAAFKDVFAEAAKSSDSYLTIIARSNRLKVPRLGLAISKRNIRHATDRNRIKRLAREAFRHHQAALAGLDIVVMARGGASTADYETLALSFRKHWAHLLRQCKPYSSPSSESTAT